MGLIVAGQDGVPTGRFAQETTIPFAPKPSEASRTSVLNDPSEARTIEILCETTCRIQNPDIPRAGRVEAHGRTAGRGRSGLDVDRTIRPGDKRPSYPTRHRKHVA